MTSSTRRCCSTLLHARTLLTAGRDANGNWIKNGSAYRINPPSAVLAERSDQKEMYFNTHMRLLYKLAPSLNLSAFGSYSYTSNENSEFCPTWLWAQGNVYRGEFKKQEYLGNVSLDYAHTLGYHSLSADSPPNIITWNARHSGHAPRA